MIKTIDNKLTELSSNECIDQLASYVLIMQNFLS